MEPKVKVVLEKLKRKQVVNAMYRIVREYANEFLRMGITPGDIKDLLELKMKTAFLPDAISYSLERPGRGDYVLENFDNPSVQLANDNEKRFADSLCVYYRQAANYTQKIEDISKIAEEHLKLVNMGSYNQLGEKEELRLLADVLQDRNIDVFIENSRLKNWQILFGYNFFDFYYIDDNRLTLKWKAGEILESKGFLDKGSMERVLKEAGVSVDKLQEGLSRYKIDMLRVSEVDVLKDEAGGYKSLRCMVDGEFQDTRELSAKDAILLDRLGNWTGMAVKYYADILEKNRKNGRMIADEKTLARMLMPFSDRLVDIYRNGMNEQDMMLAKASEKREVDSFWWSTMLWGMEKESFQTQKDWAFDRLIEYIDDLRPDMLTDEEVIRLARIPGDFAHTGREQEHNLMKLPEVFFPLIEQSGVYSQEVIDYAKVQRGIGRVTPTIAYNSMSYFLPLRLVVEWDPTGAADDDGQVTEDYFYPNDSMKNPAEKFPPNLLSEQQWSILGSKQRGAASFIPQDAFRENRITEVHAYPQRNGELNIRCKVDGEQQSAKQLSEADSWRYRHEKIGLSELATVYFADAFARETERDETLRR